MTTSATTLVLCGVLMTAVVSVNGSAIEFGSTSTSIKPLITRNLTMRCSLHDTTPSISGGIVGRKKRDVSDLSSYVADPHKPAQNRKGLTNTTDNVDFVTSMVISKDGVDVAALSEHVPARSVINSPGLHVTGSLSGKPGERGFLELTWQHPTKDECGNYRCNVDSIDRIGHSFDFSKTLQISEEEISLSDLVSHVQEIERDKDNMKNTIDTLTKSEQLMNATIDNMTKSEQLVNATISDMMKSERLMTGTITVMNATIAHMMKSERLMNATILDQKKEIISLQQKDDDLESQMNKTDTNVFFSVGLTNKFNILIPSGQVIKYDHVITNEGGAYQPGTGVFTCPVSGFYTFVMNAETDYNKAVSLKLQHNNKDVIHMFSNGGHDYESISNSATLRLDKDDTVRVITDQSTIIYSHPTRITTTFSGHLIAVV